MCTKSGQLWKTLRQNLKVGRLYCFKTSKPVCEVTVGLKLIVLLDFTENYSLLS